MNKIAYTAAFKSIVRENPLLIRKFLTAYKNNLEAYAEGGVTIRREHLGGCINYRLWSVDIGEKKLFVKETLDDIVKEKQHFTGYQQFKLMKKLEKYLGFFAKLRKHDLEVIDCRLGANYGGTSFLVTSYTPLPNAQTARLPESLKKQFGRFQKFAYVMLGAYDITEQNSFYDESRNKLLLNDPGKVWMGKSFIERVLDFLVGPLMERLGRSILKLGDF